MQISPILSALALIAPVLAGHSPRELNHAQMARTFGFEGLSSEKCYGSPQAPWEKGCYPGWYKGSECGPTKGHHPKHWDGGDKPQCGKPHAKDWSCCKPHAPHDGHHGPHGPHGGPHGGPPPPPPHHKPSCGGPGHSKPPHTGPVCDGEFEQTFYNYTTVAATGYYAGKTVGAAIIDNDHYLTYGLVDTTDECLDACDDVKKCVFVNVYREYNSTIKDSYGKGKLTCALYSECNGVQNATNYGGQDDPTYVEESTGYCKSGKCAPLP